MKAINCMKDLIGLEVQSVDGGKVGDEEIAINFTDGNQLKMLHEQSCCENVEINDIDGDIQDLVGGILVQFDESSNSDEGEPPHEYCDSWTWTFYNIATTKGFVNIRWLGNSNGYYSESVTVCIKCKYDEDDYSTYITGLGQGWKAINEGS